MDLYVSGAGGLEVTEPARRTSGLAVNASLNDADKVQALEERLQVVETRIDDLAGAAGHLVRTDVPEGNHG